MAGRIKKLQDRHAEIISAQNLILDQGIAEGRELNDAEVKQFAKLDVELKNEVKPALEREEALQNEERQLAAKEGMSSPPSGGGYTPRHIGSQYGDPAKRLHLPSSGKWCDLHGIAPSSGGFKDYNEFCGIVDKGLYDPRMDQLAQTGQSSGTPSEGGYFVPTEFAAQQLDASLEDEVVRPRADVQTMKSDTKKIAGFDMSTASGGTVFGGFKAVWASEGSTNTAQTAKTISLELHAEKLLIYGALTREVMQDGEGFAEMLGGNMIKALSHGLDSAFLTGTGAGQPLGVQNATSAITVAKETGQTASTVVYENLAKMFARLHPRSVKNSVWVASQTCIPQFEALSLPVGTGGVPIRAMTETSGEYFLMTRPVVFTEKVPTLGTVGDVMLVDFSQYSIGLRQDVILDKSMHAGWSTDETFFRTILRGDGRPRWNSVYTPMNGDTLSWCVLLATRA